MTPGRRRRYGGKLALAAVIVLIALWCAYWYAASRVAEVGIDRVVAAFSAGGRQLTCSDAGMNGFPLTLDLHCTGGKLAAAENGISAGLDGLTVSALLYQPGHVEASLAAPFVLDAPHLGVALTASWAGAALRVDAGLDGLQGAAGTLDGFTLDQTGDSPRLPFRHVVAKHAFLTTGAASSEDYRVDAAATGIVIERIDGTSLPPLSVDLGLLAEKFGTAIGTDPRKTLAAWAAKGGALHVEHLTLIAGPTSVQASGTLNLASSGLFSGTLTLRTVGINQLPALAETLAPGSGDKVAQLVGAMSAFMKPVPGAPDGTREMMLLVQNGVVFAGMLPLGAIPPLKL